MGSRIAISLVPNGNYKGANVSFSTQPLSRQCSSPKVPLSGTSELLWRKGNLQGLGVGGGALRGSPHKETRNLL